MRSKRLDDLTMKLSKYGAVQIIKDATVFTLLMTGENLTKIHITTAIMKLVLDEFGSDYPVIEAMRNDKNFYCLILAPKKSQ